MYRYAFWTIVFLILLRLAIGWQFFIEGTEKVKKEYTGETGTSKPFTSAGYFREAQGPIADQMREWIGDDDQRLLQLIRLKPADQVDKVHERIPPALEKEWDHYFNEFVSHFQLDDAVRALAQTRLDQAKGDVVDWMSLHGADDEDTEMITVTRTFPGAPDAVVKVTPYALIQEYEFKLSQIEKLTESMREARGTFNRDVLNADLAKARSDAREIRDLLLDGLAEHTEGMQKRVAEVLWADLPDPTPGLDPNRRHEELLALLTPHNIEGEVAPDTQVTADMVPEELATLWEEYGEQFTAVLERYYTIELERTAKDDDLDKKEKEQQTADLERERATAERWVSTRVDEAQLSYAKWLLEPGTQEQVAKYRQAVADLLTDLPAEKEAALEKEVATLHDSLWKGVQDKAAGLKRSVQSVLNVDDIVESVEVPEEREFLYYLDWATRWGLTALGVCLLVGFCTRFAAFGAAIFLLMTYLAFPPFPWLPTPPNNEGTYLIVNKNLIEMLALFVLMTVPSGRWFGVDGLLAWVWGAVRGSRRRRKAKT